MVETDMTPREPSYDECRTHAALGDGWYAVWYPQMGGHAGKAAVRRDSGGCVDCYVWHDGRFPFCGSERSPVKLHHCDMDQFRQFADVVDDVVT